MINSDLIVYTYKDPLYCCSFVNDSIMAACSNNSLILWDFAQGRIEKCYKFQKDVCPIYIVSSNKQQNKIKLIVQMKETKLMIFEWNIDNRNLILKKQYGLDMIGFTKLPLYTYRYNQQKQISRQLIQYFYTINYSNNRIQKWLTFNGQLSQQYELQQKIIDICYLLYYQINNNKYLLICQQNGIIKQYSKSNNLQLINTLEFQSSQSIKIILSIEPISNYQAYLTIRNHSIYIINLKSLSIQQNINIKMPRLIRSISQQRQLIVISKKNEIILMRNNKIDVHQRLDKSFILDIDIYKLGVIGITQQGKILILPIE